MDFVQSFDLWENELLEKYRNHPIWKDLPRRFPDQTIRLLLQLGYLSRHFVSWYEQAKLGFADETLKEAVRQVLRNEIPAQGPTHQDDRLHDLLEMQITKEWALEQPAFDATRKARAQLEVLICYPRIDYDLRVLSTLHIAGEILVGETYRQLIPVLEQKLGFRRSESRFYVPHAEHDARGQHHGDCFRVLLVERIKTLEDLVTVKLSAEEAFSVRYHFLDQFL